jgi:hypothetical protein
MKKGKCGQEGSLAQKSKSEERKKTKGRRRMGFFRLRTYAAQKMTKGLGFFLGLVRVRCSAGWESNGLKFINLQPVPPRTILQKIKCWPQF